MIIITTNKIGDLFFLIPIEIKISATVFHVFEDDSFLSKNNHHTCNSKSDSLVSSYHNCRRQKCHPLYHVMNPYDLKFKEHRYGTVVSEAFLRNLYAILIMSDRCNVFYFLCPECRRTVAVPESSKYGLSCPYCSSEMKAIITED